MDIYGLTGNDILRNVEELHQIVFEVTDACNLACDYCLYSGIYSGFEPRESKNMLLNTADAVIDFLVDIWTMCDHRPHRPVFVGFYGGEPLLNMPLIRHIISRLESVRLKNRRFIYTMTSNAVLLNEFEDYLAEKKVSLLISLDGPGPMNQHRHFKNGRSSFDVVQKNIQALREHHPLYYRDKVNFNTVISSATEIEPLQRFFITEFGKSPRLSEINATNISECGKWRFSQMYRNKAVLFQNAPLEIDDKGFWMEDPRSKMAIEYITNLSGNSFGSYLELLGADEDHPQIPSGTCAPFYKKMFVTVLGKILQCEKISHDYFLGRVINGKVDLNFEHVAEKFNSWISQVGMQCANCKISKSCPQCIFQLDSMLKGKVVCNHRYNSDRLEAYHRKCLNSFRVQPSLYEKIINDVTVH